MLHKVTEHMLGDSVMSKGASGLVHREAGTYSR